MKLHHELDFDAGRDAVWALLTDLERVVLCLPGARIVARTDDDAYRAVMAIRLGPMSLDYEGEVRFESRDAEAGRAVLSGTATDARGQGGARATIVLELGETETGTLATLDVDLVLSGRVAQMGGRMLEDVSARLVEDFGNCLTTKVAPAGEAAPGPGPTESSESPQVRPMRLMLRVLAARVRRLFRVGLAK